MSYKELKKWAASPKNHDGIVKFLLKRGFRKTSEIDRLSFLERFFLLLDFYKEKTGVSAV